nr:MAG TPA: hypothetical protein [Caudoviricetes sp.]
MGGRGASSGISVSGKVYGSEYHSILKDGNIKFVVANEGSVTAPMETMTKGRVYVTVDEKKNKIKHITYYDNENKRVKQIDLYPAHNGMDPHTHHGYWHNENDSKKGAGNPTRDEKRMIERVKSIWYNYINNK